ncbi:MAG TPA: hemerythrin domain-containing protein [Gemmatimonadales bacterium]|jgi:Hemerythrin HHE cation binding domain|nr:hemerythrin domain-containing protein [Gemmatimonadales bacterium]HRZ08906.1 hemerythrin domain-containing protein [Gemmatimonadales bacterium]
MPQVSTVPPEALPQIPSALQVEHRVIHEALLRATKAPGDIGTAARELAGALHDHFVREEEIALPPLGLLAALARGEFTPEMRAVLPMTEALRAELPRMLDEHQAIHAATRRLGEVARKAGNAEVQQLAEALALHAQSEEEVFYPAALLVGEVVESRSQAHGS